MTVKCTCGGVDHCQRCFGAGEYLRFTEDTRVLTEKVQPAANDAKGSFSLNKGKTSLPELGKVGPSAKHSLGKRRPVRHYAKPQLTERYLSCPICAEDAPRIRLYKIKAHLERAHKITDTQLRNLMLHRAQVETAQSRRAWQTENAAEMTMAEDLPLARDPRDGSKNVGYPSRDSGRYGSFSPHDSFDDESGPD